MNILSPALMSFWFKYLVVASVIWFILMLLRRRSIDKRIKALLELSDNRKERIINLYSKSISMYRLFLWIMPICFLLSLALLVLLFIYPYLVSGLSGVDMRQFVILVGIASVVVYVHMAEDTNYKKKILQAIDIPVEREMP